MPVPEGSELTVKDIIEERERKKKEEEQIEQVGVSDMLCCLSYN